MTFFIRTISLFALLLTVAVPAWGQEAKGVGVVTALTGKADLKRPQAPEAPLKLHDNLFVRDVVDTHEQALARILLMSKSSVTVRELSRFEIREETRPDGTQRALIDLAAGKIRVMVARRLMKPGDEVQIRTPNAVASVRGSDGIIETTTLPDGRPQTSVLVASGTFEMVTPSTRPIAMAETVVSDAPAGLWVAQARVGFTAGPSQVVVVTGPPGLQQVVQRFDPGAVNAAVQFFRPPSVASGTAARSEPNEAAVVATMEALTQIETLRTGEQPAAGGTAGTSTTTEQTTSTTTDQTTSSPTNQTTSSTGSDVITPTETLTAPPPPTETPTSPPPPPTETPTSPPPPTPEAFDQLSPGNQRIAQALCQAMGCTNNQLNDIAQLKLDGLGWGKIFQLLNPQIIKKKLGEKNLGRAVSQFILNNGLTGGNPTLSGIFNVADFVNSSCAHGACAQGSGSSCAHGACAQGNGQGSSCAHGACAGGGGSSSGGGSKPPKK